MRSRAGSIPDRRRALRGRASKKADTDHFTYSEVVEIAQHEVEYATGAAESKSAEQIRQLEKRLLDLERSIPEPSKGSEQTAVEVQANSREIRERVSKAASRRAAAREKLEAVDK